MNQKNQSWKDAWLATPGPKTQKEYLLLSLKGFCMGAADIIPGVSGGTIAFITGIYSQWLSAIASVDLNVIRRVLSFDLKGALSLTHVRFLMALLFGVGLALVSTAHVMHFLITTYPVLTWSMFLGLILASISVVGKGIESWNPSTIGMAALGAVSAYLIVGLIPVDTPETWWFLFFSGMIAICAMVLPGLSGSFILLVLGKYEFVTAALKNPFSMDSITTIIFFASGAVIGIVGFSRVLRYLLEHYRNATIAFLTGIMIGAMRKVWPWKEVLETKEIRGKVYVLQEANVVPSQLDTQVMMAVALIAIGFAMVFALEKISARQS